MCAWLGVGAAEDVDIIRRLVLEGASDSEEARNPDLMQFYGYGGKVRASAEEVAQALQLAGSNAEMTADYRLLVHAQFALLQFDFRVCVIDACGAAEVAATAATERALLSQDCPAPFVQLTMKRARGLMDAHQAAIALGLPTGVAGNAVERLAKIRNRAAHAGETVDRDSTEAALTTARQLVFAFTGRAQAA